MDTHSVVNGSAVEMGLDTLSEQFPDDSFIIAQGRTVAGINRILNGNV
jgi:hypothetical protein